MKREKILAITKQSKRFSLNKFNFFFNKFCKIRVEFSPLSCSPGAVREGLNLSALLLTGLSGSIRSTLSSIEKMKLICMTLVLFVSAVTARKLEFAEDLFKLLTDLLYWRRNRVLLDTKQSSRPMPTNKNLREFITVTHSSSIAASSKLPATESMRLRYSTMGLLSNTAGANRASSSVQNICTNRCFWEKVHR